MSTEFWFTFFPICNSHANFSRVRFQIKHPWSNKLILKHFYHHLSNTPVSLKVDYIGFFFFLFFFLYLYVLVSLPSADTLTSIEKFIMWSKVFRSLATTVLIPDDFTFIILSFILTLVSSFQSLFDLPSVSQAYVCNLHLAIALLFFSR